VAGASDEKVTAGAPDHIVLTVEPPLVRPDGTAFQIRANGTDAAFILATVVDAQGHRVPTASNLVTFAVSGPGTYRGGADQLVTAGKPVSYHAPGDPELQAEGGMCKVAVRAQFAAGTVTVTATSPGLGSGTATFAVNPLPADAATLGGDAAASACGNGAGARFTLLAGADDGLVRDNVTGLVWMRDSQGGGEPPQTQSLAATYCARRGMRLPAEDEAVALAAAYASCAFGPWGTWTSTAAPDTGYAWVVDYTGGVSAQLTENFPSAVLCARDPGP
jgi:hypothetical protein